MEPQSDQKLTPEETARILQLHRQAREVTHAIGQTEIHKAKLIARMADLEEEVHQVMEAASSRMGIPKGTSWSITPDGSVVFQPPGQ